MTTAHSREAGPSKQGLIDSLLHADQPGEVASLCENLSREEGYNLSSLLIDRLFEQPPLFRGSSWLMQAFHCLAGPLTDLPEGINSLAARGTFKSGDIIHLFSHRDQPLKSAFPGSPYSNDVPEIITSFCNKLDLTLNEMGQQEAIDTNTDSARLLLATWSYIMVTLIHPFWDASARVARNIFRYVLGPKSSITFPQDCPPTSPPDFSISTCLQDVISYFITNNWLDSKDPRYFANFKDALLRNIQQSDFVSGEEVPYFYLDFNLDAILPLMTELKKHITPRDTPADLS